MELYNCRLESHHSAWVSLSQKAVLNFKRQFNFTIIINYQIKLITLIMYEVLPSLCIDRYTKMNASLLLGFRNVENEEKYSL